MDYFSADNLLLQGMRIVQGPDEFVESLLGAQREATASFGINTILIEKYITQPRHIEVQVPIFKSLTLLSTLCTLKKFSSILMYVLHVLYYFICLEENTFCMVPSGFLFLLCHIMLYDKACN